MHSIHVIVQLMQNLYLMNTSLTEHILDGPVGVHYIEILLYLCLQEQGGESNVSRTALNSYH